MYSFEIQIIVQIIVDWAYMRSQYRLSLCSVISKYGFASVLPGNQRLHLRKMKAVTFTFAQSMTSHLLGYRLRPSQMVRFVLPNANATHITCIYSNFLALLRRRGVLSKGCLHKATLDDASMAKQSFMFA